MTQEQKPRRPKGSESIYTRKDGSVIGRYEVETPEGKKRKYVRGKNRQEVARKLTKAIADAEAGNVCDDGKVSVGDYLDK